MWCPSGIDLRSTVIYPNFNDITSATSLFEIILLEDDTTLLYSHPDIATKILRGIGQLQPYPQFFPK